MHLSLFTTLFPQIVWFAHPIFSTILRQCQQHLWLTLKVFPHFISRQNWTKQHVTVDNNPEQSWFRFWISGFRIIDLWLTLKVFPHLVSRQNWTKQAVTADNNPEQSWFRFWISGFRIIDSLRQCRWHVFAAVGLHVIISDNNGLGNTRSQQSRDTKWSSIQCQCLPLQERRRWSRN